jgi:hypothetical protein
MRGAGSDDKQQMSKCSSNVQWMPGAERALVPQTASITESSETLPRRGNRYILATQREQEKSVSGAISGAGAWSLRAGRHKPQFHNNPPGWSLVSAGVQAWVAFRLCMYDG